jgi:hypothetical protein
MFCAGIKKEVAGLTPYDLSFLSIVRRVKITQQQ